MSQWKWELLEKAKSKPLTPLPPYPAEPLWLKRHQDPRGDKSVPTGIPEDPPVNSVRLTVKPEGMPKWLMRRIMDQKEAHESADHVPSMECMFCLQAFRRWQKNQLSEACLKAQHEHRTTKALNLADNFLREHGVKISRKGFLK